MDIIKLAQELNRQILCSQEYKELKNAEETVENHKESRALLKEYLQKKDLLIKMSNHDGETVYDQRSELMDLYNKVDSNKNLMQLMESVDKFIKFKESIHTILDKDVGFNKNLYLLETKKGCNKKCGGCK